MKNKILFVTGVSGTGKSEVCRQLVSRGMNAVGIDETAELCCWVNKETGNKFTQKADFTKEFINAHSWHCDLAKLEDMIEELPRPLILCGSVDNILDVLKLSDKSLLLVCSPETSFARIDSRKDNEYGKSEGAKEVFLDYYQTYNQQCISAGAETIDAEQPIEKVVEDVLLYIK